MRHEATRVQGTPAAAEGADVAVVIPCYNEEAAIGQVVVDFRAALPQARIVVVDNNSSDATAKVARAAGAEVYTETRRGKGFALLRGFRMVRDAEFVVMVDGDCTYPAEDAGKLVQAARDGADMVIGTRLKVYEDGAYPAGHTFGNRLFIFLLRVFFGARTEDLFSGYRVLSRRFLDFSPLLSRGFEVETELSIQAVTAGFIITEIPVHYRQRPANSHSKLRTVRDGTRILLALLAFFRDYRPLTFFGGLGLLLALASAVTGGVVVSEFLTTGHILRIPLAILSVGLGLVCAVSLIGGLILSSINRRAAELAALIAQK
jgi:glycosyltransferase involved in cell wall biosynthesis